LVNLNCTLLDVCSPMIGDWLFCALCRPDDVQGARKLPYESQMPVSIKLVFCFQSVYRGHVRH